MDKIQTDYLQKCIDTLQKAYDLLQKEQECSTGYEVFRSTLVKGFEMTLAQSWKLLKKKITPYFGSKKEVDRLTCKDIFRQAHKHSLISEEEVERWLKYRDNRNTTVHDYGQAFAEETLPLIKDLLKDVNRLRMVLEN